MSEHEIAKALEIWILQTLLNVSIVLGLLATGLAMVQDYYRAMERRLSLTASIEIWRLTTAIIVDVLLAIIVLIGYLVLNPGIMADIKMAVPFYPIATIFFAVALVLRLFRGGHIAGSSNAMRSLYLMFVADLVNVVGYTFVMEAASEEYLAIHPSPFWEIIKRCLRSNADPDGLELSQMTFYVCFPILMLVLVWGAFSALRQVKATKGG